MPSRQPIPQAGSAPPPENPAVASQTAEEDVNNGGPAHERNATTLSEDHGSTGEGTLLEPPTGQDWEKLSLMNAPSAHGEEHPLPTFATEVLQRVAFATVLALVLQWSTTGATILIHLKTPPMGVGCRAMTFIIYGVTATLVFWFLLFSSILAHLAGSKTPKRTALKDLIGCIATFTRWLGKVMAILNGLGILLSCIMQFAGVYDSCFCSSSILGGNPHGIVSFTEDDVRKSEVYVFWIGGVIMAFGSSIAYAFAIYAASPMG